MSLLYRRYNYAINNPLVIRDDNGFWPYYIHYQIINESFPGMSRHDLQAIKHASYELDFGKGQQDPTVAFQHGVRDGQANQNPLVAQKNGDDFISRQVQSAQQAQADWVEQGHTGIAPSALSAFGNALHTVTDRTSPSHQGNQPWYNGPWYNRRTLTHVEGEANIDAVHGAAARAAAQQLFIRTFGNQFF